MKVNRPINDCHCDKCHAILEIYGTTTFLDKEAALDCALYEGWDISNDGKCYCPECAKHKESKQKQM